MRDMDTIETVLAQRTRVVAKTLATHRGLNGKDQKWELLRNKLEFPYIILEGSLFTLFSVYPQWIFLPSSLPLRTCLVCMTAVSAII